jgi:RimJ/RimL family protein N-acetyltransferase
MMTKTAVEPISLLADVSAPTWGFLWNQMTIDMMREYFWHDQMPQNGDEAYTYFFRNPAQRVTLVAMAEGFPIGLISLDDLLRDPVSFRPLRGVLFAYLCDRGWFQPFCHLMETTVKTLGFLHIYAKVHPRHMRSRFALRALGFHDMGLFPAAAMFDGELTDVRVYYKHLS